MNSNRPTTKRSPLNVPSFKPWPENEQRLAFAGRIGVNVSELINEVLRERLEQALEEKPKKLRK